MVVPVGHAAVLNERKLVEELLRDLKWRVNDVAVVVNKQRYLNKQKSDGNNFVAQTQTHNKNCTSRNKQNSCENRHGEHVPKA